ncbi:MAG: TatD family hydrolase [Proteobacteria bacterium]|nr:TatD family hydrolase [Pseudomonadota bacterium]
MILFDSHCHLDDLSYDSDISEVMERAQQEQVQGIMIVGVDLPSSRKAIQIAQNFSHVITSVGIHPHDASRCSPGSLETLKNLATTHPCVKAWGETGLDFNRMFSPQSAQEACFSSQLSIAGDLDLPLIFHERDSNGRLYDILKSEGSETRKGVIHCFSGTRQELFKYLDLGYHIGITGILTIEKRGAYLREIAPLIPEDRLLIETDAPYLTPAPQKNKTRRNEPAFVKYVLLKLAQIRQSDPDELSRIIFENTLKFYRVCP